MQQKMKQSLQLKLDHAATPKKSIFNFFVSKPKPSRKEVNYKSVLRRLSFYESQDKQLITLLKTIEIKDPYTKGHSESVAYFTTLIARNLDLDDHQVERIQFAALLHDVGKIMIDRKILSKPSTLNSTEESIIKKHPEMGARILSSINVSRDVIEAVMHHHERWDGTGYPNKLFAYEIPYFARILAVADAFDAMISDRPYRSKKEIHHALDEISRSTGYQFDPEISDLFIRVVSKM
jgi:putative nucleotidyltransferase with HDIG domain